MEFRTRFSKKVHKGLKCEDRSRAKQADKDACDINNIIARYKKTGILPEARQGFYADVSNVKNYQESLNQVIAAENAFGALPAKIRDRFKNDPSQMLAFIEDPKNVQECIELGIMEKIEKPDVKVEAPVEPPVETPKK